MEYHNQHEVGEEGEGSHPARRATQQRGCQPHQIDQEPTGRNYRVSRVVPCYRRESVTTGRDHRRERDPRRGERVREGAVRCQLCVAVRCKRTKCVGSGRGKARRGPRSTNTEDRDEVTNFRKPSVPTEHLRRECNTREQGHQGHYLTDNSKLATVC